MENLKLSDMFLDIEEEQKEVWKIDNDLSADWSLDKIREAQAEHQRFEMVAKAKIKQIQEALNKSKESMEGTVGFFQGKLLEYFATIKPKETKTQMKYTLPSGNLILKKGKLDFDYDKDKLLTHAKENKMIELIKTKEEFDWAGFKKCLKINETMILNSETGEVVEIEGLTIKTKPEEFKVEV